MAFGRVSEDDVYYGVYMGYLDYDEQVTLRLYRKRLVELKDGK